MDYDAEYFEHLLREQEQTDRGRKEKDRDNERKNKDDSIERSRDERYQGRREKKSRKSEEKRYRKQETRDQRPRPPRNDQFRRNDYRGDRGDRRDFAEKDPYYRDRRQIEKARDLDPTKAQKLQQDLEKRIIIEKKQKEVDVMTQKFKEAQKQLEEAKREDLTVLVYCLPLKAREDDIWGFFKKELCGKVRDIRIIKDPRSLRSKGVAYVEFYTSQSVQKALRTDGRMFDFMSRQSALKIQHSQAEKNRAAAVAKDMRIHRQVETPEEYKESSRKQTKVLVGGLVGKLADISERELKEPFQAFGTIDKIEINKDPITGRSKGFAFLQYSRVSDAQNAVKAMDKSYFKGQHLDVTIVNVSQVNQQSESNNGYYENQNFKPKSTGNNLLRPPMATETTTMMVIYDIFTMQGKIPAFFDGLKKEFTEKCSSYGTVNTIFVERNDQGNIWVKFDNVESARKAKQGLQKIFFDGNRVKCYAVTETTFKSRVTNK